MNDMFETPDFDLKLGQALAEEGIARAANSKKDLLLLGRLFAKRAALRRPDRTATADDSARGFRDHDMPSDSLGMAAGALFRESCWEFTGRYQPSMRVSNHARENKVWRLHYG